MERQWEEVRSVALRFAFSKGMPHADAEDLAQEVSVDLFVQQGRGNVSRDHHAVAWIVAKRRFSRYLAERTKTRPALSLEAVEEQVPKWDPEPKLFPRRDSFDILMAHAQEVGLTPAQVAAIAWVAAAYGRNGARSGLAGIARHMSVSTTVLRDRLRSAGRKLVPWLFAHTKLQGQPRNINADNFHATSTLPNPLQ